MRHRYLEVTFRKGRPVAAYLYLPRVAGDASVRTERHECGLLIDYAADGRAIGVEITAPSQVTLAALNRILAELGEEPASEEDLAPLIAAEIPLRSAIH